MNTKERILALLEANRGRHLSGEEIAALLAVSRGAVWKAMEALRRDGHEIQAVTNRGYALSHENSVLSLQGLLPFLDGEDVLEKIHVHRVLASTNKTAKELAIQGHPHGTVVLADSQTAGRGRYGRSFYSPPGSGLYMSVLLHARQLASSAIPLITAATAVAVCRAIQSVTGESPGIKWVNDIFLRGKKVCGILTEAVTDFESGAIDWIVIGIGVNITTGAFPPELSSIATSLLPDKTDGAIRNRLAAELIHRLLSSDDWVSNPGVLREYRDRLILLGKPVTVLRGGEPLYEARAVDVDELCHLIVEKADGSTAVLSSGEVSVRL